MEKNILSELSTYLNHYCTDYNIISLKFIEKSIEFATKFATNLF